MLKLGLLGPLYVELDETPVEGFVSAKAQALLCYLVLSEKAHSRHALAGLFWGSVPEKKASGTLRVVLSNLRKLVPGYMESSRVSVAFRHDRPHWLDVVEVEAAGRSPEGAELADLERAASRLRGEFLEDFYIDDSPEFESWLLGQRTYWRGMGLAILNQLATRYLDARRYDSAVGVLRHSLQLEPWDEVCHRRLMEALARMGDFNGALAQYEACSQALEMELGVEPMPETTALYRRIQAARRQEAYVMPQDQATFIGRDRELSRIETMLADRQCRLLTIVGLGGSGKTRLALAAARRAGETHCRQFLNGIVFVPLAALTSADDLPFALGAALDLLPEGQGSPTAQLMSFLADKELLIVLDNAEHLAGDLSLLQRIIQGAPDVKMLVTSREPLRMQAEWRLDLRGMRYPQLNGGNGSGGGEGSMTQNGGVMGDPVGIASYEAVALFVQTARQTQPAFLLDAKNAADVVRVCHLVAGMPLGVKLAAAWSRAMSPAEIADEVAQSMDFLAGQFRDLPRRQRSVRAVFESTWARLTDAESDTFAALYVFCGGFTARAAASVAALNRGQLLGLVERGLVQRLESSGAADRYDLHPLMRQFAGEKLAHGGRSEELAGRHCRTYLDLAASSEADLFGPTPQVALSTLRIELDNLRQAWQWAVDNQQFELLHAAAGAMAAFFEYSALFEEGIQSFSRAAQRLEQQPVAVRRDAILSDLLAYQISLTLDRGIADVAATMERLESLVQRLDDDDRLADLHLLKGRSVERLQGFDAAVRFYERAVTANEALDRPPRLAKALNSLGFALANLGRAAEGIDMHRRSLQIAQVLDDARLQVLALALMGFDSHYLSRHREALAYWEEALAQYTQLKDELSIVRTSNNICYVQNMLGNYEEALQVAEHLQSLIVRLGDHVSESDAHDTLGDIYFSLGDYAQARYHYLHAIDNAHKGQVRLKEAWCLTGLAELDIASGRYGLAESHLERAQALYQEDDHPRDRARLLAACAELCRRSGNREAATAYYGQAIAGVEEGGEPIYTSPLLVRAGEFLLEAGELSRAQSLIERGLAQAHSIGRRPTIVKARVLLAQLAHRQGDQSAIQALERLLANAGRDAERAEILYALWQTSGKRRYGERALADYRRLAQQTPDVSYRERCVVLETAMGKLAL